MTTQQLIDGLQSLATRMDDLVGKLKEAIDMDDTAAAEVAVEELADVSAAMAEGIGRLVPETDATPPAPGEPNATEQPGD